MFVRVAKTLLSKYFMAGWAGGGVKFAFFYHRRVKTLLATFSKSIKKKTFLNDFKRDLKRKCVFRKLEA